MADERVQSEAQCILKQFQINILPIDDIIIDGVDPVVRSEISTEDMIACLGTHNFDDVLIQSLGRTNRETLPDFPRIWLLFGFLPPQAIRNRVFEPCLEEMREDLLIAWRLCQTRNARRWLTFCFTVRTAVLVVQSLRAWIGDRALRFLQRIGLAILGGAAFQVIRGLFK
jgi:hypothetical protein